MAGATAWALSIATTFVFDGTAEPLALLQGGLAVAGLWLFTGGRLWPEPKPVRLSISGCESERDLRFRVFANGAVTGHVGLTANNLSQGQERITAVRFELRQHYRWRPSEKIANLDPKENPVSYGVQQGWPLPPANEPEERPAFFAVPLPCALSEGKTVHLHALAELGHEKRVVRAAIPIVVEED